MKFVCEGCALDVIVVPLLKLPRTVVRCCICGVECEYDGDEQ